jgi:hypothetical protein
MGECTRGRRPGCHTRPAQAPSRAPTPERRGAFPQPSPSQLPLPQQRDPLPATAAAARRLRGDNGGVCQGRAPRRHGLGGQAGAERATIEAPRSVEGPPRQALHLRGRARVVASRSAHPRHVAPFPPHQATRTPAPCPTPRQAAKPDAPVSAQEEGEEGEEGEEEPEASAEEEAPAAVEPPPPSPPKASAPVKAALMPMLDLLSFDDEPSPGGWGARDVTSVGSVL